MNIKNFFYTEKFNVEDLYKRLYEERPGAVLVKGLVRPEACELLLGEVQRNRELLRKTKEVYGRAEQRFFMHYFGFSESGSDQSEDFHLASSFSRAYDLLSKPLVLKAGLTQQRVSSSGIHIYWEDDKEGLSPHRDASSVQLTSVFILKGRSSFFAADDYALEKSRVVLSLKLEI